jgi:hypothetical protein
MGVAYEGDVLPADDPVTPWSFFGSLGVELEVVDGVLVMRAVPGELGMFFRGDDWMQGASAMAMSSRVWFSLPEEGVEQPTAALSLSDGERTAELRFMLGAECRVELPLGVGVNPWLGVACEQPHEYRIEVVAGLEVRVSIDGHGMFSAPYGDLPPAPNLPRFGFEQFGVSGVVSSWDWVRIEACPAGLENRPPWADAGADQEAAVGQWVRLDGRGSHDPDGDALTYQWSQVAGPEVALEDATTPEPSFVVPPAVDYAGLTFALVVSDGRLESAPAQVDVLVRASAPDEEIASLLEAVGEAGLNPGQARRLRRLLEDAMSAETCAAKLELLGQALELVQRHAGGSPLVADLQELVDVLGPCTRRCREDGGIEGVNLALQGRVADWTSGPRPLPGWPVPGPEASPEAAIDGEPGTSWVAPGFGHELVVDLGARKKVTGFRVISARPQAFRLEVWDDLVLAWRPLVAQAAAVQDVTLDTCDTAARFVRFIQERTEGSADTELSELEILGPDNDRPRLSWVGSDPALGHERGTADGTAWRASAAEGPGWLSTGPGVRLAPGRRWVEFRLRAGEALDEEAVLGQALVVSERSGRKQIAARRDFFAAGLSASVPLELDFQAEAGSAYAFEVYTTGQAELALAELVVKDHPGAFRAEPELFLVERAGRAIRIEDEEHALHGLEVRFSPGSVPAGSLVEIGLGQTVLATSGAGAPVSSPVRLAIAGAGPTPLAGPVHLRIPLDRRELQAAGIGPRDLELAVQTGSGERFSLPVHGLSGHASLHPRWLPGQGPRPFELGELTFQVDHRLDDLTVAEPAPGTVLLPTGFSADYAEYNLLHFPLEERAGAATVADESGANHPGTVSGAVQLGVAGVSGRGARLHGGSIRAEVGRNPKAFALDFYLWLSPGSGGGRLASQAGNFELETWEACGDDSLANACGHVLALGVYDAVTGQTRPVAATYFDAVQFMRPMRWYHVVAVYDGHFMGRIYVQGAVNTVDIARREISAHGSFDPGASPGWPRRVSEEVAPLVLGGPGLDVRVDEVRFSDLGRFRERDAEGCPPRCLLGEHGGVYNPGYTNPLLGVERPAWRNQWMHTDVHFDYRSPFVQQLGDHRAVFSWRRHARDEQVEGYGDAFLDRMEFCFGEAGAPMDRCVPVFSSPVWVGYANHPDREYVVAIDHLRPSTWYHYKVVRRTAAWMGNDDLAGPTRFELASDVHFRTAPLGLPDPFEFIVFGDFSPTVSTCFSPPCDDRISGHQAYDRYEIMYQKWAARHLRVLTSEWGQERPSFWLSVGDLDQTSYDARHFESYLFGMYNKVDRRPGAVAFRGVLGGMDLKAALGNHNWLGSRASEYMQNLRMQPRVFPDLDNPEGPRDLHFKYPKSSYSADFGNLHAVSLNISYADACDARYGRENPYRDPGVDNDCYLWDWKSEASSRTDQEKMWSDRRAVPPADLQSTDSDQIAWLKRDLWRLKDDDGIWKVVFFHVPISDGTDGRHPACTSGRCGADGHMSDEARSRLTRFFEHAGVDLIFTGHEHRFHLMSTRAISSRYLSPGETIPPEEHAVHIIAGTGGYAHDLQPDWPWHVGIPRFFVDWNMLYLVFRDLNDERHTPRVGPVLQDCLLVKGVPGILKSACQPLDDYPTWECPEPAFRDGSRCLHFDLSGEQALSFWGRCVRLRTRAADVVGGTETWLQETLTWPGTWGPGLRCIPWPGGEEP